MGREEERGKMPEKHWWSGCSEYAMGQEKDLLRACKRLQGLWYELRRDSEMASIRTDVGNPERYGVNDEAEIEDAMELIPNPS